MKSSQSISCIVPVYNGELYVQKALDSIFQQTLLPAEVIVIDDGSTDRTRQIIEAYEHDLIYVKQENSGPASARNHGISLAGGHFLSFLDADDLWRPDKLALQMAHMEQHPEIGYCLSYKRQFWEPAVKDEEERLRAEQHPITRDAPGYVMQTMLARRSTFEAVGLLDESLRIGEDTDWLARAEDAGIARDTLPEVLVYRRLHRANLSYQAGSPRGIEDRWKIILGSLQRKRQHTDQA